MIVHKVHFNIIQHANGEEMFVFLTGFLATRVTRLRGKTQWLSQVILEILDELEVAGRVEQQVCCRRCIRDLQEAVGQCSRAITCYNRELAILDAAQIGNNLHFRQFYPEAAGCWFQYVVYHTDY